MIPIFLNSYIALRKHIKKLINLAQTISQLLFFIHGVCNMYNLFLSGNIEINPRPANDKCKFHSIWHWNSIPLKLSYISTHK